MLVGILPIWHIAKHLGRHEGRLEIFLFCFVPSVCCLYVIYVVLEPNDRARFHVIGVQVAFNSRIPNQLIANIYIHNDAGEADIVAYSYSGLAKADADQREVINELRKVLSGLVRTGQGLHFTVRGNEDKWFTIVGPTLSDEQVEQFKKGKLPFYFMASVVIQEQTTSNELEHCGFVLGDRPNVIIDCPSFARNK
jgi:hypothetical protein